LSNRICEAAELVSVRDRIQSTWNFLGANDANLIMGWIGQAALGQYPLWRTHMYINGKNGSGKSTLCEIISDLLGSMSVGVLNDVSSAAIRQSTNLQAHARIFDEAESKGGHGRAEDVIGLFRLMSGAEGARVERGTSDHAGVRFELHGAGLLASIIPAVMSPQDRSRFVMLTVRELKKMNDPAIGAAALSILKEDAEQMGPQVWARMVSLSPKRWDQTFRFYNSLIQGLGGRSRNGDTIGAILAGWDLMLFDDPLLSVLNGEADASRVAKATEIALPLISAASEAEEEGEGERCLRTLFSGLLQKDHGGVATVADVIEPVMQRDEGGLPDRRMLGRIGLSLVQNGENEHWLFVANGQNPLLDKVFANTQWRGGGHKAALTTLDDVRPSPTPRRVAGRPVRGLLIPPHYLPGFMEVQTDHTEF
jgi:hypothetical protein